MKLKEKLKIGILAGGIHSILMTLSTGFFIHDSFTIEAVKSGVAQGTLFGILFGFGFPPLMDFIARKVIRKIKIDLNEGESLIYEGPANLFRGIEGVGGKLFLTSDRLHFKSHKMNIQNEPLSIPLDHVAEFSTYRTSKVITFDNGLKVSTMDLKEYKFVVNNRDKWVNQLLSSNSMQELEGES